MLHQRDLPAFPQDDPAVALVVADLALDADLFAVPRLDAGKTGPGVLHHDRRENLVGIRGPEIQKDRAGIRDGDLADRVFDHHFLSRLRRCGFRVKHVPAERLREQPGNHEDEDQLSHVPRVVDCGARHKDLFLGLRERIVFGGAGGMIRGMSRVLKELKECPRIAWEAVNTFNEIDGEQRAASFAYYALFSLVPLFALMLTAGSSFFDSQQVIHTVEHYFPMGKPQQELMWPMVASLEKSRGSVTVVSFVILTWCSLKFFQALVRGVNRAWHTVEIPWWQLPLKNLLMIAVLASALLIGLLAPALVQGAKKIMIAFKDFLESQIPALNLDTVVGLFDLGRYAVSGAVLFYSFTLLYMLAPRRRVFFRQVWIPALLVTLSLQFCQNAFVNYLPRFVNYNAIYGTVGVMMLLMLWVYITGVVIFMGACLCSAAAKIHGDENALPSS